MIHWPTWATLLALCHAHRAVHKARDRGVLTVEGLGGVFDATEICRSFRAKDGRGGDSKEHPL